MKPLFCLKKLLFVIDTIPAVLNLPLGSANCLIKNCTNKCNIKIRDMKKVTCVERINQVVFVVVLEYRNSCTKTAAKLAEPTISYN